MRKEFKLTLDNCNDYGRRERGDSFWTDYLCSDELREFFNIRKGRKNIIGVLSDKPSSDAYLIEVDSDGMIRVEGKFVASYQGLKQAVKRFPANRCYGHIEWDV